MVKYKGYITILDLNNELKKKAESEIDDEDRERLEELAEKRKIQKAFNYKSGAQKRKIRKELKSKGKSENIIKKEQNKVFSYNLGVVDNEMKMLSKDIDFKYIIHDRFNDPYAITAKELLSKNAEKLVMDKYVRAVNKSLEHEWSQDPVDYKKVAVLEKLLAKAKFNKDQVDSEYDEYDEDELNKFIEEYDYESPPIFIEFFGENLLINL